MRELQSGQEFVENDRCIHGGAKLPDTVAASLEETTEIKLLSNFSRSASLARVFPQITSSAIAVSERG